MDITRVAHIYFFVYIKELKIPDWIKMQTVLQIPNRA